MTRFAFASLMLSLATVGVASAEDLIESVPVEPGGTLRIDLDRGRVQVRSHDEDTVRIEAHAQGLSAIFGGFELSRNGNDVSLKGRFNRAFLFVPWGPSVTVDAWVPSAYAVVIHTAGGSIDISDVTGSAVAQTSGGHIHLKAIRGPVSVETSGGAIRIAHVSDSVVAHTSGGRIDINAVDGNVEAHTSGGAMEIYDVAGRLEAVTSGGAISVSFRGEPAGVVQTSGGAIDVAFPADAPVSLDAQTSGGEVSVEHDIRGSSPSRARHVTGQINGGGALLQLRTSGGNIRVHVSARHG